MASGKLGAISLAATTNTTIYTVPTGKVATFNVNIVNTTTEVIKVRLALSATATPTNAEYIEYDVSIPANGVLERTGLMASAGEMVVVYASTVGVSVRVYGIEE